MMDRAIHVLTCDRSESKRKCGHSGGRVLGRGVEKLEVHVQEVHNGYTEIEGV